MAENDGSNKKNSARPPNLSLKNVKTEDSPSRLPSLRGPRDLTLGGVKKKTFAPNIPVRKNRAKVEVKDEKSAFKPSEQKRARSRDTRGRGRGRGRGSRNQVIQQHSIFESGPTVSNAGRGGAVREASQQSSQIQKPTIKKEKFDFAKEKSESDEVLRKLDQGNASIISDLHNDESLAPMMLPLYSHPPSNSGDDVASLFRQNQNKLMLIQIPDTLPGVCASDVDESDMKNSKKDGFTSESRAGIDQLSDGFVGKLQLLKSGRCRLKLGGLSFDVKMGTPATFAQELVSIRVPQDSEQESKGHVCVLDEVSSKLVCVPDVSNLINSC